MSRQYLKVLWWLIAFSQLDRLATGRRTEPDERKILVVRLDGIGDFVLWLNAAAGLRTLYPAPRCHITLLGNRLWTTLARDQGSFDDVWEMDLKRFAFDPRYRFRLMRRVAEAGFSVAINPAFARDFLWSDAIIRASRAPHRIGYDGALDRISAAGRVLSDPWYTRLVHSNEGIRTELERNAEFVRELGLTSFEAAVPAIETKRKLPSAIANRDYYVLAPFAGYGIRQWPLENFARVAERLYAETGWLGVVCGGPGDREASQQLLSHSTVQLDDYTGRVGLADTLAIIAGSRLTVGNETGLIHMAAASGTPSVCILGGGHYGRFLPYPTSNGTNGAGLEVVSHQMDCFGCNWQCIYNTPRNEPAPCITNVSVDSVWRKTLSIVHKIRSSPDAALDLCSHRAVES